MIKKAVKIVNESITPILISGNKPNIFLFSTPRSGSTWLMELINSQNNFMYCFEPFNYRNKTVRKELFKIGIKGWNELYSIQKWEQIKKYKPLLTGRLKGGNPTLFDLKRKDLGIFNNNFRLIAKRVIFKILHAGEHKIDWFEKQQNGQILYLIRHPIPTSISRQTCPRINIFLNSDYKNFLSKQIIKESVKILNSGNNLQIKVLSWCLQNYVPLKAIKPSWILLSYEQLVKEFEYVVNILVKKLELDNPERMIKNFKKPSFTANFYGKDKNYFNSNNIKNKHFSISSWREKISYAKEKELMEVLDIFELNHYKTGYDLPNERCIL